MSSNSAIGSIRYLMIYSFIHITFSEPPERVLQQDREQLVEQAGLGDAQVAVQAHQHLLLPQPDLGGAGQRHHRIQLR